MSWLAPAALAGALLVAFPILIHMMGRGRTTVIRFPSLRFLETSRIVPARGTRIHDIALLLLRAGAIVAAAVALAQPRFRAQSSSAATDASVAQIIVLDTSASMQRAVQRIGGVDAATSGATAGKRIADSLAKAATRVAVVVRSVDLRAALRGAEAWAAIQSGRAEIAVVSDFQRGALDGATVAALDQSLGIQLYRVRVSASPVLVSRSRQGGADVSARIALVGDRTDVEWAIAPPGAHASPIQLRAGAAASELVTATRHGAEAIGVPSPAADFAVVFPGDASLAVVRANAHPLTSRAQAGIAVRLLNDPLLASASGRTATVRTAANSEDIAHESPVERVGATVENGRSLLFVIARAPVGTAASAALVAAVERAASTAPPVSELDAEFIPDATLARWQRAPGDRPALKALNRTEPADFDGRWFWLLALLLLGGEGWLRRVSQHTKTVDVA